MKKNKGFTLIELLAVIVVLAIIALIATPIVMNTIKNSKKGAAERSGEAYIKQVETAIVENRVKTGNTVSDGTYEINNDGNICLNSECTEKLDINMNGDKPSSGTIKIINGQVESATDMVVKDYNVSYTSSDNKYVVTEKDDTKPEPEVLCTAKTTATNGNKAEGNYNYGDEYSCDVGDRESKTFYVLENNGDTVSLIMNMNIDSSGKGTTSGNTVPWSLDGDSLNGPVTALSYLASSTASWTKLNPNQISLPSGQQIATAGGDTEWIDSIYTGNTLSSWLYENLCVNTSGLYGYWTSTPHASDSFYAWYVSSVGILVYGDVDSVSSYGVRPVITISKSQIS